MVRGLGGGLGGETLGFGVKFGFFEGILEFNFAFLGQFLVKLCIFGAVLRPILGIWGQTLHFWGNSRSNFVVLERLWCQFWDLGSNFAFLG